jgi:hypothetical protein
MQIVSMMKQVVHIEPVGFKGLNSSIASERDVRKCKLIITELILL